MSSFLGLPAPEDTNILQFDVFTNLLAISRIIRGYQPINGPNEPIEYVVERDTENINFLICREEVSKCKYNLGQVNQIVLCYSTTRRPNPHLIDEKCPADGGIVISATMNNAEDVNFYGNLGNISISNFTDTSIDGGGKCLNASLITENSQEFFVIWMNTGEQKMEVDTFLGRSVDVFEGDPNLAKSNIRVRSSNIVCGFYLKFVSFVFISILETLHIL